MGVMSSKLGKCYGTLVHCAHKFQHLFLLLVRLYWGWGFFVAGKGKLMNLGATADTFEMWEIPMPGVSALMAGAVETLLGLTLMAGFVSRVSAIPLIVVMVVAYLTAHADDITSLNAFVAAPPFTYLFACLIVLLFGPGKFSLDHLIKHRYGSGCVECDMSSVGESMASSPNVHSPIKGHAS